MKKVAKTTVIAIASVFIALTSAIAQNPPKREITNIAGDLYRFQNNFHFSVFLVTPEGVIATDPIDTGAAEWLKAEITSRFDAEVKYLIYSHDHRDHIAGGEVFDDTAIVVAHEQAKADIISENRPTAIPELTFTDQLTITLGGKTVELSFVGKNHSDNTIVMNFPAERTLFAVDFIPIKTVAFRDLPDAYVPEWIESLKRVEAMDFDILAPGHGGLRTKADVAAYRGYMTDLLTQTEKCAQDGATAETIKDCVDLSKYADWGQFEAWSPLNIDAMFQRVQLNRRGN